MSSEFQEAQSNCIHEKSTNLITIYSFRNLYRKTSLGDLLVPDYTVLTELLVLHMM